MSGTYRHGRTYCQVPGCRARVRRAVEIDLPMAWEAAAEFTALTVVVGLCGRHGHEVARRVGALLEARSELPQLLSIIEGAAVTDAVARDAIEEMERALVEAEGALAHERERAERAERALRLIERTGSVHEVPALAGGSGAA